MLLFTVVWFIISKIKVPFFDNLSRPSEINGEHHGIFKSLPFIHISIYTLHAFTCKNQRGREYICRGIEKYFYSLYKPILFLYCTNVIAISFYPYALNSSEKKKTTKSFFILYKQHSYFLNQWNHKNIVKKRLFV